MEIKSTSRVPFLSFLQKHGDARLHAASMLFHKYKSAFFDARRLALSALPLAVWLAFLRDWGVAWSIGKPAMRLTMPMTHTDLASVVGCSRETLTRLLERFKRENVIDLYGAFIHIHSPETLERIAA